MEPPASQGNSHFTPSAISGSVLAAKEVKRRDAAVGLGLCRTGCSELDDYVLLGGLERGCVVGLSAEDEEVGVQLGLQTLAHALCREGSVANGLVVTPKPAAAVLGALRDAVGAELRERGVADDEARVKTRACLDRVMLSCVFDLDGLWEVLADLDRPEGQEEEEVIATEQQQQQQEQEEKRPVEEEIADSQDEDDEPLSPLPLPPAIETSRIRPDIVVITHFSSLLTSLFTHREKSAAHATLQLLGAHMRHLVRSLSSCPLMLLLNSTSSSSFTTTTTTASTSATATAKSGRRQQQHQQQPLDPTLRSIFNPLLPPTPSYGPAAAAASSSSSRRNKPSFGMVFAQLLDVHLLATRLPRGVADAKAAQLQLQLQMQQQQQSDTAAAAALVRTVWVVEVLLDEAGVWEGKRGVRRSREQRWAAVDVERGRVRDAAFGDMEGKG